MVSLYGLVKIGNDSIDWNFLLDFAVISVENGQNKLIVIVHSVYRDIIDINHSDSIAYYNLFCKRSVIEISLR